MRKLFTSRYTDLEATGTPENQLWINYETC